PDQSRSWATRALRSTPASLVDPYLPIESFRRRDEARNGLVALVADIMNGRIANPPTDKSDRDMLDVLIAVKAETGTPRFSADDSSSLRVRTACQ
ncbi:hypothetical protein ACNJQJ_21970, partial [Mycobacterium tuberculosis]